MIVFAAVTILPAAVVVMKVVEEEEVIRPEEIMIRGLKEGLLEVVGDTEVLLLRDNAWKMVVTVHRKYLIIKNILSVF